MKMRLMVALLACVAGISSAEWAPLGVTSKAGTSYFLDTASVQKASDGKIRVSYLVDMSRPEESGSSVLSMRGENEFDCKAKMFRNVSLTKHAGRMAAGDVISVTEGSGEWSKIPPRSRVASMFTTVCKAPVRPVQLASPSYLEPFRRFSR